MVYDQREKARRDYLWGLEAARKEGIALGRQIARQAGWQDGLRIGKVQMLQELLNQEPSSTASLLGRSAEELESMFNELYQQLCWRSLKC